MPIIPMLWYVTVPGKTDHFVQILRYWYHIEARYSLHATVKSESRERIPFLSNAHLGTGAREIILAENGANLSFGMFSVYYICLRYDITRTMHKI